MIFLICISYIWTRVFPFKRTTMGFRLSSKWKAAMKLHNPEICEYKTQTSDDDAGPNDKLLSLAFRDLWHLDVPLANNVHPPTIIATPNQHSSTLLQPGYSFCSHRPRHLIIPLGWLTFSNNYLKCHQSFQYSTPQPAIPFLAMPMDIILIYLLWMWD